MRYGGGITVASFYFGGAGALSTAGSSTKIIQTLLFAKNVSDILLTSNIQEINDLLGEDFINGYKIFTGVIDCTLIFKQFADKEINEKLLTLSKLWTGIDEKTKKELENSNRELYNLFNNSL